MPAALAAAGVDPATVVGIGTDFTASTPLPVLRDGTPLCKLDGFADRPHAYPKLWKHHAAQPQAERVTAVAAERGEPWLARYGGRISSEWEFAKALQVLDEDPEIYERDRPVDRGRRLDRLAALRRRDAQRRAPPATRRISRTAAIRTRTYLRALNPAVRRLRPRPSSTCRCRRSARAPAA